MDAKVLSEASLLDLRPKNSFGKCHILNSTNIPLSELIERIHELPSNSQPINLLGYQAELISAMDILEKRGYHINAQQAVEDEQLLSIKDGHYVITGEDSKPLWKPAKVVESFVQKYADLCEDKIGLDLACGSGRDSVYMALNGWSMTSVDHSRNALDRLQQLAKINQQSVRSRQLDLEQNFSEIRSMNCSYSAIVVVRYLHRPILDQLRSLIAPKGFIIYQTFLRGSEQFGSPKNPRYLLEDGELANRFSDFKIYENKIDYLPDGRPTNCFIAQKLE